MVVSRVFLSSLRAIGASKLRAALASLAVLVAVVSLIVLGAAVQSAELETRARLKHFGSSVVIVQAGTFTSVARQSALIGEARTLRLRDVQLLTDIPHVRNVAALYHDRRTVKIGQVTKPLIVGAVQPQYFNIRRMVLTSGGFFDTVSDAAMRRVAVVRPNRGTSTETVAVGDEIHIGRAKFRVLGVLEANGENIDGVDVYIPMRTGMGRVFGVSHLTRLVIEIDDPDAIDSAVPLIREALRSSHRLRENRPDDFKVTSAAQSARMSAASRRVFAVWLFVITIVALGAAGIGILVVMLSSVNNRTREIGVRRAFGASQRDIVVQFLFEASVLSLAGGVGGVVAGALICALLKRVLAWAIIFPTSTAALALGVSIAVGVCFGAYPALRAATLDPGRALTRG